MSSKGFSLIELMIVIALTGILAAIAYPSYQDSIIRSRRADAHSAIMSVQLAQERLRGDCPFYAQQITAGADVCGASGSASTIKKPNGFEIDGDGVVYSPDGFYTLGLSSATGNTYTITATPIGKQDSDSACDPITLTVDRANPKGAVAPAGC